MSGFGNNAATNQSCNNKSHLSCLKKSEDGF